LNWPAGFSSCWRRKVEGREHAAALLVGVDLDVVAHGVGGPEADDGLGGEAFFGDDAREEFLRVVEELGGLGADLGVGEDVGIAAVEFPGGEERAPVDVGHDLVEREGTAES
jgi:hypothetical protein